MGKKQKNLTILRDGLRKEGVRLTRQREALLCVLAEAKDHPDAEQLLVRARKIDPKVSLTTVYRALSIFEEQGLIDRLAFEGEAARFEVNTNSHHDHIIDIDNGEITEFRNDLIEKIQEEIASRYGYELISHKLELYCRKRKE